MKTLLYLLFIVLLLPANAQTEEKILVAAASDLQFALPELAHEFETQTGKKVTLSFGSSGNFASQIQNGAPFDLFFSADLSYPKHLEDAGLIEPGTIYHYANGKIVLWTLKTSHINVEKGLSVLSGPDIHKIAIANPEHAPYGRAAVAAMKQEGVYDRVKEQIVLAENISQAAQFVDSGAAEVGIVALSLVVAPSVQEKGIYFPIPQTEYPPIEQACAILKSSQHKRAAQQFLDFIKSPAAVAKLKQYGFEASK